MPNDSMTVGILIGVPIAVSLGSTIILSLLFRYQSTAAVVKRFRNDVGVLGVDKIVGLRETDNSFELKIRWVGCGKGDETFEPIETIMDDLPLLVERYFAI